MRAATPADTPALTAFLRRHMLSSRFALASLAGTGLSMQVWVAEGAAITGMVGLTATGMVLPQWPDGDWGQARAAMAGCRVTGFVGPADQVRPLRSALGLDDAPARRDADEPGFALNLSALRLPDCEGYTLRPVTDAETATAWRVAYEVELFRTPAAEALANATRDIARWQAIDSHRMLYQGSRPVALTGFNARLPEAVQIGGVYVPPGLRGQGHARRAVGMHLAEAATSGVRHATLFAATDAAARAYTSLGFTSAGTFALILLSDPQVVPPCP